jgi:hypothetical protein
MKELNWKKSGWYGRIITWYTKYEGKRPQDLWEAIWTVPAVAITWIFEAGFWTKWRLIRPITVVWTWFVAWLITVLFYAAHSTSGRFWVVILGIYLLVSTGVAVYHHENDPYKRRHPFLSRFVNLLITPVLAGLVYAITEFVCSCLLPLNDRIESWIRGVQEKRKKLKKEPNFISKFFKQLYKRVFRKINWI